MDRNKVSSSIGASATTFPKQLALFAPPLAELQLLAEKQAAIIDPKEEFNLHVLLFRPCLAEATCHRLLHLFFLRGAEWLFDMAIRYRKSLGILD